MKIKIKFTVSNNNNLSLTNLINRKKLLNQKLCHLTNSNLTLKNQKLLKVNKIPKESKTKNNLDKKELLKININNNKTFQKIKKMLRLFNSQITKIKNQKKKPKKKKKTNINFPQSTNPEITLCKTMIMIQQMTSNNKCKNKVLTVKNHVDSIVTRKKKKMKKMIIIIILKNKMESKEKNLVDLIVIMTMKMKMRKKKKKKKRNKRKKKNKNKKKFKLLNQFKKNKNCHIFKVRLLIWMILTKTNKKKRLNPLISINLN